MFTALARLAGSFTTKVPAATESCANSTPDVTAHGRSDMSSAGSLRIASTSRSLIEMSSQLCSASWMLSRMLPRSCGGCRPQSGHMLRRSRRRGGRFRRRPSSRCRDLACRRKCESHRGVLGFSVAMELITKPVHEVSPMSQDNESVHGFSTALRMPGVVQVGGRNTDRRATTRVQVLDQRHCGEGILPSQSASSDPPGVEVVHQVLQAPQVDRVLREAAGPEHAHRDRECLVSRTPASTSPRCTSGNSAREHLVHGDDAGGQ